MLSALFRFWELYCTCNSYLKEVCNFEPQKNIKYVSGRDCNTDEGRANREWFC